MYDLEDLQTLFSSRISKDIAKNILIKHKIDYKDRGTYFQLNNNSTLSFLHNKIMLITKDNKDIETFTVTNIKHLERLGSILGDLNEVTK